MVETTKTIKKDVVVYKKNRTYFFEDGIANLHIKKS